MALIPLADPVPIHEDVSGGLRVGETRVLLELIVRAFEDGATPETIVQRYPTVLLSDAYAVIAYYLKHRPEVEQYLERREQQAAEVERRIEGSQRDLGEIRRRLLDRHERSGFRDAPTGE